MSISSTKALPVKVYDTLRKRSTFLGRPSKHNTKQNTTNGLFSGVYKEEGWRALFKGLGPNLSGVIPAR